MRRFAIAIASAWLVLLPQSGWGNQERARVGVSTVGNLEISLYAWGPQQVLHSRGTGHPEPGRSATHHLDVRVFDLRRRMYIPYLKVKATISDTTTRREFTVKLEPMIGEWLHYGANITLPHKGTYAIVVDVQPPDIARHKHLADVWNTPAQSLFTYQYR
ncbi:MAG: iron transporter [Candidatus Methylomirabilales bacterium]